MNRGEIWWAEVPNLKRRPFLILTRDAAISVVNRVLVAPLTTTIRRIPTEVELGPADGVQACVVSLDNIECLPKWALVKHLTTLNDHRLRQVCEAFSLAVDCS